MANSNRKWTALAICATLLNWVLFFLLGDRFSLLIAVALTLAIIWNWAIMRGSQS